MTGPFELREKNYPSKLGQNNETLRHEFEIFQ